jgi:hypothetical protein
VDLFREILNHCRIDLLSFLKLPQHVTTNLVIKYLVDKKVSMQYKNLITAALKHACEINDIVLNWKKNTTRKMNEVRDCLYENHLKKRI